MQICPSILEVKVDKYISQIKRLSPFYKYFQLDFADGIYVDNKTATLDDFIYSLELSNFETIKSFIFDFHLMVKDYEIYLKKIETIKDKIKIKNVFIHCDLQPNFSLLSHHFSFFNIGLALNPQDRIVDLSNYYNLNTIPCIQIMSVIPGAQGKPFIQDTLYKIEQLRESGYRSNIFLDGAINDITLPKINSQKFKPDFLCPGSYLTKCPNEELKNRFNYLLSFK